MAISFNDFDSFRKCSRGNTPRKHSDPMSTFNECVNNRTAKESRSANHKFLRVALHHQSPESLLIDQSQHMRHSLRRHRWVSMGSLETFAASGGKIVLQPKPVIYPDNQSGAAASPKKTFFLLKACPINHCSVEYVGNTHFVQSQE
ncbi:hypothetical protein [Tateyamaria sp. SN3-11]|uniref:hypothetical protein n=1 Tax=Tateyamaria sp. SN3-11 TaxID=3092147 RepID=UPI0039E84F53